MVRAQVLTGRGLTAAMAVLCVHLVAVDVLAQRGGRGGPPASAREAAAFDPTGYWVSVVTEDWKLRMVTPAKGVYDTLPLNAEGRRVGDQWDPGRDRREGEECRAYGAANIMRMPGRLHITWEDDQTLRIDTDAGMQTRTLHFGAPEAGGDDGEPSWQGRSSARWVYAPGRRGGGAPRTGSLTVVTTGLRAGYVRTNGAPYSDRAVVTEYVDLNVLPNGDRWLTVTTKVDDPVYFTRPYLTSTDFKALPDGAGWDPQPCRAG